MRHPLLLAALVVLPSSLTALSTGCGGDERDLTGSGGAGGSGAGGSGTQVGGASVGGSGPAAGIALCDGATAPTNTLICPKAGPTTPPNCAQVKAKPVQVCGVLADVDPGTASTRTTSTDEFAGTGPVDTSCFEQPNWKVAGTPKSVKMKGFVRNFSSGCDAKGVKIEVFTVKRGGADDGATDKLIGAAVTTSSGPCTGATDCKLVDVEKCLDGRTWRGYEYPGLPTETELLIKTSSADDSDNYASLYDFNIYISNDDPGVADGFWEHPLRAVVKSDFSLIPQVAFGGSITPGNGAVAGEIHDCGDVRIGGATFGISRSGAAESYFTDKEEAPLPDSQATSTSSLGLYSAYDLTPGPVRVVALARSSTGEQTSLGYYDVRVFPDAITSMTFRGFRPPQAATASK